MGAHTRPRYGADGVRGRHRGQAAPLIEIDLSAAAYRTGAVLATSAAAAGVVVAGAGGALAAGTSATRPTVAAGTSSQFAALRQCESSGNYAVNTGNGFYGAYQFDRRTWHGLGYGGLPSAAAPAVQDRAAQTLQAERGWEPWPACSARLGLNSGGSGRVLAVISTPTRTPRATRTTSSVHLAGGVPAFPGTTLSTALESRSRSDVQVWQARMVRRGWHLSVDGAFGPQSAHVARQFTIEKGLRTVPGTVDASAWRAAWTAPITA